MSGAAAPDWKPTPDDVAGGTELSADADGLQTAIDAATDVVGDIEAASDLDGDRLGRIALYLAAHIATVPNPQAAQESAASYSATMLRETSYGETAALLDTTGTLADDQREESLFAPRVRGGTARGPSGRRF